MNAAVQKPNVDDHALFPLILLDPCCGTRCPAFTKCAVNNERNAVCVCQDLDDCPEDHDLVCGNDGKTYGNKCLMKATACKEKRMIEVVANRKCGMYGVVIVVHYLYSSQ